jgi:diaminohydroxyphosphoribosylaminopyrimidine deaminase/5-amino-6-(5-phosphoribosylamino)uracil reductase
MSRGRPWVRMKIAASLDGKTALANGQSQWITGPEARRDGHAWRARACAVLTGIGTVKDDDPQLNVREVETTRQPLKVVVDSRLQLQPSARLLQSGRVLVATAMADKPGIAALEDKGAEVLVLPNAEGKVDLMGLMRELARREINEVHVEAGIKLNGSLLQERLVDELLVYLAPSILGDTARAMFSLPELADLALKRLVQFDQVQTIGSDLRILARVIN